MPKGKPRKYKSGNTVQRNVSVDHILDERAVERAHEHRLSVSEVYNQALEMFFLRLERSSRAGAGRGSNTNGR